MCHARLWKSSFSIIYKLYGKNGKTYFQSEAVCSQLSLLKILVDIVIYRHHGQILNPYTSDTKFRNFYLSQSGSTGSISTFNKTHAVPTAL